MPVGAYPGAASSTGNGVTTVFAYNFRILAAADLRVTVDAVVKTNGADYNLSGVGDANGGNVTFVVAPANGTLVVRERARAYTRSTDYQRNGSFDEETVDADFDAVVMLVQQVEALARRSFKAPAEVIADQVLTTAMWDARASKVFGFDAAGVFKLLAAADVDLALVSAFVLTLIDDTDANIFFKTLSEAMTAETVPAVGDMVALYDLSAATGRKMTLANLFKVIAGLTAEAVVDRADELPIYDVGEGAANKATLANILVALAATEAEMEASSALGVVTPSMQRHHPTAVKVHVSWNADGTINGTAVNVASITDTGTGIQTINIADDFTSANWVSTFGQGVKGFLSFDSKGVGGVRVLGRDVADAGAADLHPLQMTACGTL